jgi:hypothetical protein
MKNTPKALLLILAVMVITACSKKNNTPTPSAGGLAGKWRIVADTTNFYDNSSFDLQVVNGDLTAADYSQFNADGTGTLSEYGQQVKFTYKVADKAITITVPTQTSGGGTVDGYVQNGTIKKLTDNELYLFMEQVEISAGDTSRDTEAIHYTR